MVRAGRPAQCALGALLPRHQQAAGTGMHAVPAPSAHWAVRCTALVAQAARTAVGQQPGARPAVGTGRCRGPTWSSGGLLGMLQLHSTGRWSLAAAGRGGGGRGQRRCWRAVERRCKMLACCWHVAGMLLACCWHCWHVAAMLLPCCCHVAAMLLPCCCHVAAMLLPCCCHVAGMLLPCCCHVAGMLLACCWHVAAMLRWSAEQGHVRC